MEQWEIIEAIKALTDIVKIGERIYSFGQSSDDNIYIAAHEKIAELIPLLNK